MIPFPLPPTAAASQPDVIGSWLRRLADAARSRRRWRTVTFRPPTDAARPWLCEPLPGVRVLAGEPAPGGVICADVTVSAYAEPVHPVHGAIPLRRTRHVHVAYNGDLAFAVVMGRRPCPTRRRGGAR